MSAGRFTGVVPALVRKTANVQLMQSNSVCIKSGIVVCSFLVYITIMLAIVIILIIAIMSRGNE
jgi:hypothetical protein